MTDDDFCHGGQYSVASTQLPVESKSNWSDFLDTGYWLLSVQFRFQRFQIRDDDTASVHLDELLGLEAA